MRLFVAIITTIFALAACSGCGEHKVSATPNMQDTLSPQERMIQQNRAFLKQEREAIDAFVLENKLTMQRTGSGLYYVPLKTETAIGQRVIDGDVIEYAFDLYLLDGTPLKNSLEDGNRVINVGHDQVEIGLHEAFMLTHVGERMLFVFPSHLAYGIAGNTDNVPPRSTVVFEIEPLKKLN